MDLLSTPEYRRSELERNYFFICDCTRCLNPIESVESNGAACSNSKCNEILNFHQSIKECPKCNAIVTNEKIERFHEVLEFTKMQLDEMKDIACKLFQFFNFYSRTCPIYCNKIQESIQKIT